AAALDAAVVAEADLAVADDDRLGGGRLAAVRIDAILAGRRPRLAARCLGGGERRRAAVEAAVVETAVLAAGGEGDEVLIAATDAALCRQHALDRDAANGDALGLDAQRAAGRLVA